MTKIAQNAMNLTNFMGNNVLMYVLLHGIKKLYKILINVFNVIVVVRFALQQKYVLNV